MCGHPWTIPGWLSYLGIPGYLDKGGACVWPSLDNPGMAKLLGNLGILGQGGGHVCSHPWIIPGWLSNLGIPRYLDKGRDMCVAILGQSRDGQVTWESRDSWTRGGGMYVAILGQSRDG